MAALSLLPPPTPFGQKRTKVLDRLNARDSIRDRALSANTFPHMPSNVFRSTASGYHCSGEPLELTNAENAHKDNQHLTVNVHTEVKTGTIYEEHVVSLVRFNDPFLVYSTIEANFLQHPAAVKF